MQRNAAQTKTGFIALRAAAIGAALFLAAPGGATAGTAFDGAYTGTSAHVQGRESTCTAADGRIRVQVVNGSFNYMWLRSQNVELRISIADDGTVSGTHAWGRGGARVSASGTAKPGSLEIDVKGIECTRHLSLRKA